MSFDVVVDRLRVPARASREHLVQAALGLAGEQRDAEVERLLQVGGSSGSIEMQPETWNPPITTGTPAARNCAREIERARKLVRLHADEADEARAGRSDLPDRALDVDDACCTRR